MWQAQRVIDPGEGTSTGRIRKTNSQVLSYLSRKRERCVSSDEEEAERPCQRFCRERERYDEEYTTDDSPDSDMEAEVAQGAVIICDICCEEFESLRLLKHHRYMHLAYHSPKHQRHYGGSHCLRPRYFQCKDCGKVFYQKAYMKHRIRHWKIKIYGCSRCQTIFIRLMKINSLGQTPKAKQCSRCNKENINSYLVKFSNIKL